MSLCTVPSCAAPTAPREERCPEHGGAMIERHRHVTYSGHVGDGAAVSGALAAPMEMEPIELVTARMPPGQLHALTFVAVKCDCRLYRDAATRVIERKENT